MYISSDKKNGSVKFALYSFSNVRSTKLKFFTHSLRVFNISRNFYLCPIRHPFFDRYHVGSKTDFKEYFDFNHLAAGA